MESDPIEFQIRGQSPAFLKDVKVKEVDLNEKIFYSGKYTGYNDDELMVVIDTHFFQPDEKKRYSSIYRDREDLIHNGKLVHFRQVDQKLDLPPGTAKRLLKRLLNGTI